LTALTVGDGDHRFEDRTFVGDDGLQTLLITGGTVTLRRCRLERASHHAIEAQGCRLILEDCVFVGNRLGVWATDGAHVDVRRCHFEGPGSVGILFRRGASGRVEDCTIADLDDSAVLVSSGATPIFERCRFVSTGMGLCAQNGGRGELRECTIEAAIHAVFVAAGSEPVLVDCRILGASSTGILSHGGGRAERCELDGNNVGIYLMSGADPDIVDCDIRGGESSGIVALDGARGRVTGCRVAAHPAGAVVLLPGSSTCVT
jgi:F-box protein 11